MPKKILFIDRDGTIIKEAPPTYKIDTFAELEFYPDVFYYLRQIAELPFELVMVTNQDGLGNDDFPKDKFYEVHDFMMKAFANENIRFSQVFIDDTYPEQNSPNRKPGTGMLQSYINNPEYDLPGSFVIGDRITDMQLAKNLGCKGIWLNQGTNLGAAEISSSIHDLIENTVALDTLHWKDVYEFLRNIAA